MREWIRPTIACGLAASLLLAGCGRGEDDSADGPGKPISEGKATGDITIWAMGAEGEKLSELADDFMSENPDAKVTVTPIPWDGAHDKIANAIAAGETPDLTVVGTTWMGEFARTGGLDPTPEGLVAPDHFFDGAWDTTVVDGTSYGVPWYVETRMIYVNKDVAAKAGVSSSPKTWDDLKSGITAMQDKGDAEWGISLQPGGTGSWQTALPFVWQNGGEVMDGDNFAFNSPQTIEALDYYNSYFTDGLSPTDLPDGSLEPDFIKGEIGAFVSGPWHMGILDDQGATGEYALWPMPSKESRTSFIGGSDLAVFKDAKNRDGAWKFIQYASQPDVQVEWYKTVAALPSVTAAWDDKALASDPQLAAFGEQLDDAKAPPTIATWEQVAAAFDGQVEKLTKTDITAKEAADAIQEEATSIGTGG
ncbi:sugar ABC transporter substrate-binding protein [Stackebrandtia soli]|uniref:sugar ABC transporter substrate-binding protein n=1 Tax=Stackebrandtia soli TaxID=1892856 RepID=UPI0039E87DE2